MPEVYWRRTVRPAPKTTEPLPEKADVAVIGAGFAGLSIASDLLRARPGMTVALIEARYAGFGASGRNAGAVLPLAVQPWLLPGSAGPYDPYEMQGLLHARVGDRIKELAEAHPAGEIRPVRMVLIGTSRVIEAGLEVAADAIGRAGIAAEHWTGDRVRAGCGAPGRSAIALEAYTIQPAALAASLAARFAADGGSLHEHTRVEALVPARDGVDIELGSGRRLRAGRVVVTTGAYTPGLDLPDPPPGKVVHTYMRASGPLPDRTAEALGGGDLFLAAPGAGMPYWRVHDGRLLFGGADIGGLAPGEAADALPRGHQKVDRVLKRRLPQAAALSPAYRWGGPMHMTASDVPHLGQSTVSERIVYAVGFAGSGVALTLSSGPLVRDLVLGPDAADPGAVAVRRAIQATTIPWRGLASLAPAATGHLLRGLTPRR